MGRGVPQALIRPGRAHGAAISITAIGSVVLSACVNTLGSDAVAAVTAGNKLSMFFCCVFDALSSTMATYAGQNVGAGQVGRIRQGIKSCALVGGAYCLLALGVVHLTGRGLIGLFVDGGQTQVVEDAYQFLLVSALFYLPLLFVNILRLMIQGVGYTGLAVLAGVFEMAARTLIGCWRCPPWALRRPVSPVPWPGCWPTPFSFPPADTCCANWTGGHLTAVVYW